MVWVIYVHISVAIYSSDYTVPCSFSLPPIPSVVVGMEAAQVLPVKNTIMHFKFNTDICQEYAPSGGKKLTRRLARRYRISILPQCRLLCIVLVADCLVLSLPKCTLDCTVLILPYAFACKKSACESC